MNIDELNEGLHILVDMGAIEQDEAEMILGRAFLKEMKNGKENIPKTKSYKKHRK